MKVPSMPLIAAISCLASCPSFADKEFFEEADDALVRQIDQTYKTGLNYLAKSQGENGSWSDNSYGSEAGVVGMAVLALLARGDDPEFGPYRVAVKRSLDFILSRQNKSTGYIGSSMYNHGFATLALAEAYGITNDLRLGPALQKATDLIVGSQKNNSKGAWRYGPESKDADTTVSGAQMVALLAARNAGLSGYEEAIQKGIAFLLSCQASNGGFGYTSKSGPNQPRSAIGCLVLSLAKDTDSDAYRRSVQYLVDNADHSGQGHKFYSLYYTSQAIFRADSNLWRTWNIKNFKRLKSSQGEDGSWSGNYGKAFSTSAALLSLALNYRYLPIYERTPNKQRPQ